MPAPNLWHRLVSFGVTVGAVSALGSSLRPRVTLDPTTLTSLRHSSLFMTRCPPSLQEAVSTGVIRLLKGDDYVCSTYRDHVHALSKNVPPKEIMAELFGKKTGICRGQGGSMHMFSKQHGLVRPECAPLSPQQRIEMIATTTSVGIW